MGGKVSSYVEKQENVKEVLKAFFEKRILPQSLRTFQASNKVFKASVLSELHAFQASKLLKPKLFSLKHLEQK